MRAHVSNAKQTMQTCEDSGTRIRTHSLTHSPKNTHTHRRTRTHTHTYTHTHPCLPLRYNRGDPLTKNMRHDMRVCMVDVCTPHIRNNIPKANLLMLRVHLVRRGSTPSEGPYCTWIPGRGKSNQDMRLALQPLPCNPAASPSLQPLAWYSES